MIGKEKIKRIALITLAVIGLVACGNKSSSDKTEIGIIQYADHEALVNAKNGFIDELKNLGYVDGENTTIEVKNANADQSNLNSITQQFKGKKDLIFTIATPAAQAMANADRETPILFSAVTDPVAAKLVESENHPGGNVSGTTDAVDASKIVDVLLKANPNMKTIGFLYNSSEVNSEKQLDEVKVYADTKGLSVESMAVSTTNDVQAAMTALVKKVDGIYLPTDNTVAATISTIGNIAREAKIPVVGSDAAHLDGALATYGVNFYDLGKQTADQAVKILKKEVNISELPVERSQKFDFEINNEMAAAIGINPEQLK